jgi:putative peptidoglycan lipid II flippase
VALGIFCSRIFGLLREAVAAAVFGAGGFADVFATAFRAPNILQTLLGEQSLSASFIPIYSRFLAEDREEEAGRFAGAIFGLLLATVAALTVLGMLLAEPIVAVFAAGYLKDAAAVAAGEAAFDRFPLAVRAVRIVFPMTGVLVLSAWSLGVLNSHRRFFLPYFAPVLWNASIIAALAIGSGIWLGYTGDGVTPERIVIWGCFGALVGSLLQFLVQLPLVARLLTGFRLSVSLEVAGVRRALRAFAPLVSARGAVQLSGYVDHLLATLLAAGAVGSLRWATVLHLLPISLFGMSVAAAELPELASDRGEKQGETIGLRMNAAIRQISYLVVPTQVGYLAFGFLIVDGLYRRGNFGQEDNWLVYLILCGYAVGLLANTWSRLLSNVFYSQGKTGIPARIAVFRIVFSAILGVILMFLLDRVAVAALTGSVEEKGLRLGAVGLSCAAGVASWVELWRLRRALQWLLPRSRFPARTVTRMYAAAFAAALPACGTWWLARSFPTPILGTAVLGVYVLAYLALTRFLGLSEVDAWLRAFGSRR